MMKKHTKKRRLGQKISLFFSIFCYVMAIAAAVFAFIWKADNGTQDPIFASALASIFFFGSCGFVLHYIANANLPDFNLKT
ncbi:MAG: hemerythrin family protein [gamma proteobacterium symbiont of Bathyaustriella thionipta]|nr:hemerythrin family protein [gamma proteobacterium symbiont of Bathyaustriella thionipta]MCU7949995.1 hemerythrin family protein [gamma proteobacterium symbiont of Bathyaustriella thionipta]MCU7952141.1 hemerythrin family protein [gamma proteobacterium symbiont of Bathyaustriella thionipta]MCU7956575.1 hemerythrin family protein [gamma proteobacterium symbiont of Bathyaustriella thionipta]MCU7967283.1 hemerythrin family protein [gamma proteobacterium symbiont of Bathyaustriella thionipta]